MARWKEYRRKRFSNELKRQQSALLASVKQRHFIRNIQGRKLKFSPFTMISSRTNYGRMHTNMDIQRLNRLRTTTNTNRNRWATITPKRFPCTRNIGSKIGEDEPLGASRQINEANGTYIQHKMTFRWHIEL